jgi:serine/threonine protein phosphatase PrpC
VNLSTPCEPAGPVTTRCGAGRLVVERGRFDGDNAQLEVGVASSTGLRHDVNEDAHSALDGTDALFVVADGVGGGAMASRASSELVALVHRSLARASLDAGTMRDALLDADLAVARSIARDTNALGAATIALCASVRPDFSAWLVAWVGDCRAYRLQRGERRAELLTRDDSYRRLAEPPPPGGSPDDPARMVGNGAVTAPNVTTAALALDGMLLLCSDGVHAHVDAGDLAAALMQPGRPLERRCADVVQLARQRGGRDDATLLAIRRAAKRVPARVHGGNDA